MKFKTECLPRSKNNERYWNGVRCVDALYYGQTCSNTSTKNECQYLTQETSCIGPEPYKCKCPVGKYFDKDTNNCETLFVINETCSQVDSCKNGICMGSPLKCQCLPLQYFDQISSQCQNQINFSSSSLLPTSYTSSTISLSIISTTFLTTSKHIC